MKGTDLLKVEETYDMHMIRTIIDNTSELYEGMKKVAEKYAAMIMEGKAVMFDVTLNLAPLRFVRAAIQQQRDCCDTQKDWIRATYKQRKAVSAQWIYDEVLDTVNYWKNNPAAYQKYLETKNKKG